MITTQALSLFLALWALSSLPTASAWDPSERDCGDSYLCLKSFVWCDHRSSSGGCYYPEGIYPRAAHGDNSIHALVMAGREYNLTWTVDSRTRDEPVQVSWSAAGRGTIWNTNTTERHVVFHPYEIIRSLPEEDRAETIRAAYHDQTNIIRIRQPNATISTTSSIDSEEMPFDTSSQFTLADVILDRFFETQREIAARDEYNKWKLGVGIGVGLGVPFLLAITALTTWLVAKKRVGRDQVVTPSKP